MTNPGVPQVAQAVVHAASGTPETESDNLPYYPSFLPIGLALTWCGDLSYFYTTDMS